MKDPPGVSRLPEFSRGIYLLQQRTVWMLGQMTFMKMDRLWKDNVGLQHSRFSCQLFYFVFFNCNDENRRFGSPLLMVFLQIQFRIATCADRRLRPAAPGAEAAQGDHWRRQERKMSAFFILQFPPGLWMNNRPAPEAGPHPPQEPASHWPASRPNVFTVHTSGRTESSCSSVACLETRSELESFIPSGLLTLMFESRAGIFCFLLPFTETRRKKRELNYGA